MEHRRRRWSILGKRLRALKKNIFRLRLEEGDWEMGEGRTVEPGGVEEVLERGGEVGECVEENGTVDE